MTASSSLRPVLCSGHAVGIALVACLLAAPALRADVSTDAEVEADTAQPAETESETETETETEEKKPALHFRLEKATDFAPAGVLFDHTHEKGDWTFSYQYVRLERRGLLTGSDQTSQSEIDHYWGQPGGSVPVSQLTNAHTVGIMYAPHDRFTFAIVLPYLEHELEQVSGVGAPLPSVKTSGIGDTRLMFLIPFIQNGSEKTHFRAGVSFPTGSINQLDPNAADPLQRLPYSMQLGSGSWDVYWGINYIGQHELLSWGGQFEGLYRINENSNGYRRGTDYHASLWIAGGLASWISTSARFEWNKRGNIRGEDTTLDKTLTPLNDNKKFGGTELFVLSGVNVLVPIFGGQRFSFEASIPVYQSLDGPQLEADVSYTAAWQWIF
jgi:hypothetical protein